MPSAPTARARPARGWRALPGVLTAGLVLASGLGGAAGPADRGSADRGSADGGAADGGAASAGQGEQAAAEVWMGRLAAPDAATRDRAQRWLATNLGADDLPALVRALRTGDAEVRRRLTDALAADARRLGAAAALYQDPLPAVRGAGEAALRQMVHAWCPACDRRGVGRGELRDALEKAQAPVARRLAGGSATPVAVLERVGRLAGLAAPLAIDPDVRELSPRRHPSTTGGGFELLEALLEPLELAVEGFGLGEDGELGPAAWIHVTRAGLEGLATGRELLLDAVARVQAGGDAAPGAAHLLAGSGWPAALQWLEERWLRGDEAVLDALLEAAARGRVAPALASPAGQRAVLECAERTLRAGRPAADGRIERMARGLAATGPLGPRGEDLDAGLLLLDPGAGPLLWLRLVALEGRGGASPAVRAALEGLLADPTLAPSMRLQVIRTLAARGGAAPAPPGLEALARSAAAAGHGVALARLAAGLGWAPPAGLRAAGTGAAGTGVAEGGVAEPLLALLVAEWLHAAGDPAGAVTEVRAVAGPLEASPELRAGAVRMLRGWAARGGLAGLRSDLAEGLGASPPGGPLARLAARAWGLSEDREAALLGALLGSHPGPVELELLGYLAAGRGGSRVRDLLLERVAAGTELGLAEAEHLAGAVSAAATTLARARQDEVLALFLREVWRRLQGARGRPIFDLLAPPRWPPRPAIAHEELGALDRTLDDWAR